VSTLAGLPRYPLGTLPTPFEPLERLGAELGVPLWVKRDDLTGLGLGGNKVRKLEYLLGDALATGCDTVVTFGALQSNHARQTAAACARAGLHCVLVLTRTVPRTGAAYTDGGNVLLDRLFGADVRVVDPDGVEATVVALTDELAAAGRRTRWVPPGGSDPVGTAGYVLGGQELAADAAAAGVELSHVVVGSSSGGTQAGLLLGLRSAGCGATVHGVAVYKDADRTTATVTKLVAGTAALLDLDLPDDEVVCDDRFLGDGYGVPTKAMADAVGRFARTEGLVLDPVYSGKAAAALIAMADSGELDSATGVAFVHTGGSPSLFAYVDELTPG
jgi:D-cysteine desulfhydrase family pyridoxal phosphate-dependent enzyme